MIIRIPLKPRPHFPTSTSLRNPPFLHKPNSLLTSKLVIHRFHFTFYSKILSNPKLAYKDEYKQENIHPRSWLLYIIFKLQELIRNLLKSPIINNYRSSDYSPIWKKRIKFQRYRKDLMPSKWTNSPTVKTVIIYSSFCPPPQRIYPSYFCHAD